MDIETFREFCLSLPHTTEGFPFGPDTLVFSIGGKMYALTNIETFESVNLKCDPEKAIELRETYPGVQPGYHMNKKHWNTVSFHANIPETLIRSWITDSYTLVKAGLPRSIRDTL